MKIFPGVRLNFSRSGVSTSVGVRGAHVTFGKNGTRTTVGIPGTGVSYTETRKGSSRRGDERPSALGVIGSLLVLTVAVVFVFAIVFALASHFAG